MKYWIGVVSKDHVMRGVELGIAQIGHGKRSGLARMNAGDGLVYYSPRQSLSGDVSLQAFTAIGHITDDSIWQEDQGEFKPWRRRVNYKKCNETLIRPLLGELECTKDKPNWGYVFRYGLLEISKKDFDRIATAMKART